MCREYSAVLFLLSSHAFVQIFELLTGGDYLFDPASGSRYSKDDDHIAQIMELMGEFPKQVAFAGKYSSDFFNRKGNVPPSPFTGITHQPAHTGELRHIQKLRYWPLEAVLHDKYLLPKEEADLIASFLTPMLRLHPEKRAKAGELTHHAWLDAVVVQGEVDVIRRAEDTERRARAVEEEVEEEHGVSVSMREVDAMKPVEVDDEGGVAAAQAQHVPKLGVPVPTSASAKENAGGKGHAPTPVLGPPPASAKR